MALPPVEFVGLARALRRDVLRVDDVANAVLARIAAPYADRLRRKPGLRREHLIEIARAWEATYPAAHSLERRVEHAGGRGLAIREVRLCGSTWHDGAWDDPGAAEPGCLVSRVELTTSTAATLRVTVTPLANVSLHSLARWHERVADRSAAALHRDLRGLAAGLDAPGDRIAVPGGAWCGPTASATDDRERRVSVRSVRTFVSGEMMG